MRKAVVVQGQPDNLVQHMIWDGGPRVRANRGGLGSPGCRSRPHSWHRPNQFLPLLPLLLLLFGVDGAKAATCPDGSAGLTRALYEGGDPAAYADVTCIPRNEFRAYEGDVVLKGLALLTSIEATAFCLLNGRLTISGVYPALETIGGSAFNSGGTRDSAITFSGLPLLKTIEIQAWYLFKGTLAITGEYPALETVGEFAFESAGNTESAITFSGLPLLKAIETSAFDRFKGTLVIAGEYPALETVGEAAFILAGNTESAITFSWLLLLNAIETNAFKYFKGTLAITGEYPALETVGNSAFVSAGNTKSAVAIKCSSAAGLTFGSLAFTNFRGTHDSTGEQTHCLETAKTTTPKATPATTSSSSPAICADGGAALTRELYEGGDPAAYADVTCIPGEEFQNYEGGVVLKGLARLRSVEYNAFQSFKGTLVITGEYPSLETVGSYAFFSAGNTDSAIAFGDLPLLKTIETFAFRSFTGTLAITGEYPALETVGEWSFHSAGTADSTVDLSSLNSTNLEKIHYDAFELFKGSVTLPTGPFPNYIGCARMYGMTPDPDVVLHAPSQIPLTKTLYDAAVAIGGRGIASFSNVTCIPDGEFRDYVGGNITLDIGMESLQSIGETAFQMFQGTLAISGEYPALETVGRLAFQSAGNTESAISFSGLPSLKTIETRAFFFFLRDPCNNWRVPSPRDGWKVCLQLSRQH